MVGGRYMYIHVYDVATSIGVTFFVTLNNRQIIFAGKKIVHTCTCTYICPPFKESTTYSLQAGERGSNIYT